MNKTVILLSAMLMLCGCARTTESASEHKCIKPMEWSVDIQSDKEFDVAASFNLSDINWNEHTIVLETYREHIYDAAEVNSLQVGDTLVYEGASMPVDSISEDSDMKLINGGIENNGACLVPNDGGTYRASSLDDHSVYISMGKKKFALAEDFTLTDCGISPDIPNTVIKSDQKKYLESLPEYRQSFYNICTMVHVKDGRVTEITRRWIP